MCLKSRWALRSCERPVIYACPMPSIRPCPFWLLMVGAVVMDQSRSVSRKELGPCGVGFLVHGSNNSYGRVIVKVVLQSH